MYKLAGLEPSNLINYAAGIGPFVRDLLDKQVEVFGLVFAEVAGMSKLPLLVEVDDVLCKSHKTFFSLSLALQMNKLEL